MEQIIYIYACVYIYVYIYIYKAPITMLINNLWNHSDDRAKNMSWSSFTGFQYPRYSISTEMYKV